MASRTACMHRHPTIEQDQQHEDDAPPTPAEALPPSALGSAILLDEVILALLANPSTIFMFGCALQELNILLRA